MSFIANTGLAAAVLLGSGAATVSSSSRGGSATTSTLTTSSSQGQALQEPVSPAGTGPAVPLEAPNTAPADADGTSISAARPPTTVGLAAQTGAVPTTTYQETSASIVYGGSWSRAVHPGYLGRRALSSSRSGAAASLRFTGTGISWIGPTGPTRGKARVYIDGRLVRTVDTHAAQFTPSRVLYSATYTTEQPRTIKIVVLGTRGHPTVAVDALIVRTGGRATPPPDGSGSVPGSTIPPLPAPTPAPVIPGSAPAPSASPAGTPAPTATSTPTATPPPTTSASTRVTSIPALLSALADNSLSEIVVANGTYRVTPSSHQGSNSLWIGSRFANRSRPVTVRAETTGGVTFDGGGTSSFGGISFAEGVHDQTWDGFTFANGTPNQTGVIVFGGYAGRAAPHHITLRNITIPRSVTSSSSGSTDHAVYFSLAVGGPHDILIDGLNVDGAGGLDSALQVHHSDSANQNAWNVTVRRMQVSGTERGIVFWDSTIRNILVEDSTITGTALAAVSYEAGGSVTLRRVTSTGSGDGGFYSSLGSNPPGITFIDCDLS